MREVICSFGGEAGGEVLQKIHAEVHDIAHMYPNGWLPTMSELEEELDIPHSGTADFSHFGYATGADYLGVDCETEEIGMVG